MKFLFYAFLCSLCLISCDSYDSSQSLIREFPSQDSWQSLREELTQGVERFVVSQGQGETLDSGMSVRVHYIGWYDDGTEFYNSIQKDKPYRFKLGVGRVIPSWELSLKGLNKGTQFYLRSDSEHAFGDGQADGLRYNARVTFGIHVLD